MKKLIELPRGIRELAWGPAPGQISLLGADPFIEVLDADTLKPLRMLALGPEPARFAFSPDGEAIAWSTSSKKVEIRNLRADKPPVVLETENNECTLAFSPDGKLLATGGIGGSAAELWDTAKGELVSRFVDDKRPLGLLTVAYRPNGKHVAIGNRNAATCVYQAATGKLRYKLPPPMPHELTFSPDSSRLAVGYVDRSIRLWDAAGGELLHIRQTAEEVWTVDWSPAGDVVVTGGLKGTIILWDPRDLSVLKEWKAGEQVQRIRFSPDGSRLLIGTTRDIQVWGLPPSDARQS